MGGVTKSLRGQLLLSAGQLWDPNFRRTVVLIGHHDEEGAVGVVLNRASEVTVVDAAPALAALVGADERVFLGGPVQPETAVVLAEFDQPERAEIVAFGDVGFLPSESDHGSIGGIRRARMFAGYSGWGPGQLEGELEIDSWIVEPALAEDVFTPTPERLWSDVLRRKGPEHELLRVMPFDPSSN